MFKIIIESLAEEKLDAFVNAYKNIYRNLFYDSGILEESIIIQNYENIGDSFVDFILSYLQKNLIPTLVLGRKVNEDGSFSLVLRERSFLIIVDYTEDISTQTRFIEDIIFTKK